MGRSVKFKNPRVAVPPPWRKRQIKRNPDAVWQIYVPYSPKAKNKGARSSDKSMKVQKLMTSQDLDWLINRATDISCELKTTVYVVNVGGKRPKIDKTIPYNPAKAHQMAKARGLIKSE